MATRKTWPKVAIIVLNWNGWRDTIKCLESLLKFQYPKYDVIVIDNGSSDNSVGSIQGWLYNKLKIDVPVIDCTSVLSGRSLEDLNEHFIIIQNKENLGVGAGYNVGLGYAARKNYKWVFLLDQDSIPQADVLQSYSLC